MSATSDDHLYAECGLPSVVLADVMLHACATCGERLVAVPRVEGLHRTIARALVGKRARLTHREVRFLRKYLGWSAAEFARYLAAPPETAARFEDPAAPLPMGEAAERLLRLMVSTTTGTPLPLSDLLDLGVERHETSWLRLELAGSSWRAS
jgi:DNA-binding transcriptional regulator YiaG